MPAETDVTSSPGELLRTAREAKGLSTSDVAASLHLNSRAIVALENEDYDSLGGRAFVTGYLRAYAKLVGLDVQTLLSDYRPEAAEPELLPNIDYPRQSSLGDWPMRIATLVLVGGLATLLGYWWVEHGEDAVAVLVAAEADGPVAVAKVEEPLRTLPDPRDVRPLPDVPAAEPLEPVSEPVPPADVSTPNSRLVLRYSFDSWTEVRDADDRQLVYGLIKAGRDIEVDGPAPFEVFLGYGPGVSIEYNGEEFEHQPYTRRDSYVARFVVDDPQGDARRDTQQP
jgi:cytoskeleton protein RodZ